MKKCFSIVLCLLFYLFSFTQITKKVKLQIDSNALKNWTSVGNKSLISNNGSYFMYSLFNPLKYEFGILIQSTSTNWAKEFVGVSNGIFTEDSKQFVFQRKDTLQFLQLGYDQIKAIGNIQSYKLDVKGQWLAYKLKSNNKELILLNLSSGVKHHFEAVGDYLFDNSGSKLIMRNSDLRLVNLSNLSVTTLWDDENARKKIGTYSISSDGTRVAFIVNQDGESMLWYYEEGMGKAVEIINNRSEGIDSGLFLNDDMEFSPDGKYIYTHLKRAPDPTPPSDYIKVDVWNYKDTFLQSFQLNGHPIYDLNPRLYDAVINLENNRVIRLWEKFGDFVKAKPVIKGDYILVANMPKGDRFWLSVKESNWLMSLKNGNKKLLSHDISSALSFSPDGNYLLYYEESSHNYFSYDLQLSKQVNLTSLLPSRIFERHNEYEHPFNKPMEQATPNVVGIAAWSIDCKKALVYDDFDLWQLDLSGREKPINITNGYGRKHKIKFRLVTNNARPVLGIRINETLLLTAFNFENKENGFYQAMAGKADDPKLLTMGPYTYFHSGLEVMHWMELNDQMVPLKGRDADFWIVMRQSAHEARNFYVTREFKSFKPLTDFKPEENYNWVNSQLITWKQSDGNTSQGILYKPDNFDPKKKYPVLVVIYQRFSQRLYEYPLPGYTESLINIPWFISRDYLVFTPDIHFETGKKCESSYRSISSGIEKIKRFEYVQQNKIALVGHSQSGQMVYYAVTKGNLFAAAIAGAGISDAISSSLSLSGAGYKKANARLGREESVQGVSLWAHPERYLENSPILNANKIKTPLLIFHSMIDGGVPWEQAVEMFIALRRNNRPVWMLQYDNGQHGAFGKDAVDYTIRITQFFDHYLKDMSPPRWMTEGIRASRKGVETGYGLDYSGKKP